VPFILAKNPDVQNPLAPTALVGIALVNASVPVADGKV
jgi:hypothetical protein